MGKRKPTRLPFKKKPNTFESKSEIAVEMQDEVDKQSSKEPNEKSLPILQVEQYLNQHYDLRINIVLNKVEGKKKASSTFGILTEYGFNSILRELLRNGIPANAGMLRALLNSNYCISYNPFKEYFSSLPERDIERDYIEELAESVITSDQQYWKKCFKKWIVAKVACAVEETITNHTVIVFSGKQGIGKTTWLQNLVPEPLKKYYYSGVISPANKDTLIHLSECILINLDELESLNRSELGDLKAFITKDSIRVRRPYERDSENYIRRASFVGSVNKSEFLHDMTGNRRFLCFEVESIDFLKKFDLEMVYSQAYHLYKTGFRYWFNSEDVDQINNKNEQFRSVSLEEEWLLKNYESCELGEEHETRATMDLVNLMSSDMKLTNLNSSAKKLGAALNSKGFKSVKRSGRKVYLLKCSPFKYFGDNIKITTEEDNLDIGQVG
jgi:predicted P-loop ATPase